MELVTDSGAGVNQLGSAAGVPGGATLFALEFTLGLSGCTPLFALLPAALALLGQRLLRVFNLRAGTAQLLRVRLDGGALGGFHRRVGGQPLARGPKAVGLHPFEQDGIRSLMYDAAVEAGFFVVVSHDVTSLLPSSFRFAGRRNDNYETI